MKFARTRDRLISDWGRLEHSKNALQTPADARAISQEQRRIEWLLRAYGVQEIPQEVVNPLSRPVPTILWHGPDDFARFADAVHEWELYFASRKPSEDFLSMLETYERTRRDPRWTGEPDTLLSGRDESESVPALVGAILRATAPLESESAAR